MKGLLGKDFLLVAREWKSILLLLVGVSAILIWQKGSVGLVSFFCIMMVMQGVTSLITDKMNGFDQRAVNFPVSRENLLREKYIFSFLLFVLAFPVGLALSLWLGNDVQSVWCSVLIAVIFSFSVMAVGIPLLGRMQRSNFFIGIFVSFIPAALMVAYWSQCISVTMTIGEEYVVDMAMDVLGWFAAGSVAAALLSMLVMPMVLARYDLN